MVEIAIFIRFCVGVYVRNRTASKIISKVTFLDVFSSSQNNPEFTASFELVVAAFNQMRGAKKRSKIKRPTDEKT